MKHKTIGMRSIEEKPKGKIEKSICLTMAKQNFKTSVLCIKLKRSKTT